MTLDTRRSFNGKLLGSLMTFGLLETLYARDLFADPVKPVIDRWVRYQSSEHANIHRAVHHLSEKATAEYEAARRRAQAFLNAYRAVSGVRVPELDAP